MGTEVDADRVRAPIPPMAWVMSGATAVALAVLAASLVEAKGTSQFYLSGDPRLFLLTARDLFGTGHGFAALGRTSEIPYRYGRVGLPFLGWVLAFGRPAYVGWTMIGINIAAIAAIPGLAAVTLSDYGAPPAAGVLVLAFPALVLLYGSVVSDPLVIALLLLVYVLDRRGRRGSALLVLAAAILVKEIAVVALIPLLWRAFRSRDRRELGRAACTVLPYAAWCVYLKWRVGEFPFFAHAESRQGALGLPFAGLRDTLVHRPDYAGIILGGLVITVVLGASGAWLARGTQIGALAGLYTLVAISLGPEALKFVAESARVYLLPEVFGLLALVIGIAARRRSTSRAPDAPLSRLPTGS